MRDGNMEIYTISPGGLDPVRRTNNPAKDLNPNWSPDGQTIAFQSERDGNSELYLVSIEDGTFIRLTEDPGEDSRPAWSPDGTRLAYFHQALGQAPQIRLMGADGTQLGNLGETSVHTQIQWAPDNESVLAYRYDKTGTGIYRIGLDGQNKRLLIGVDDSDNGFSLAADNRHLAFTTKVDSVSEELFLVDLHTNKRRRLTHNGYADLLPSWSPDGKKLVFTTFVDGPPQLAIFDIGSGHMHLLTKTGANFGAIWR